jgi:ribosomal-protein-alanine N-acetyltransferase
MEMESCDLECCVALSGGDVVGYICTKRALDEAQMLKLVVHPSMRRKGVARALVSETVKRLRGSRRKHICLEVRASNASARRIYETLEFKTSGTKKSYYHSSEEDATLMALEL